MEMNVNNGIRGKMWELVGIHWNIKETSGIYGKM